MGKSLFSKRYFDEALKEERKEVSLKPWENLLARELAAGTAAKMRNAIPDDEVVVLFNKIVRAAKDLAQSTNSNIFVYKLEESIGVIKLTNNDLVFGSLEGNERRILKMMIDFADNFSITSEGRMFHIIFSFDLTTKE